MATLTVTHTENITIEGRQQGSTKAIRYENISDVYSRVFSFKQGILTRLYTTTADTVSGGVFDDGSIKYVRITNLGNEAIVINIILETSTLAYAYEIQPNESYYLYSHTLAAFADNDDAITTTELGASLSDIDEIKAYCHRAPGKVDVFIASTDAK
jgi:hypothetical protein|tara:strand:+ start:1310 stop:1777 length:468 start_codon:yes stop_codon:yes gene_type:complete